MRFFNTAGPCKPNIHYMLPVSSRLPDLRELIDQNHEIAPHIALMAFLDRVANGRGTLEREYAIGSRWMDVCLRYGKTTLAMELKVWRDGQSDPLSEGLEQLDSYLGGLGLETGWLVIFDQRSGLPDISERTTTETTVTPTGRTVIVIRG
jgi:hypothetical protein